MRRRRGPVSPEPPPVEVLDGPLDELFVYAQENRLDSVELIKLRSNRRRAHEGTEPRYRIDSLRG